MVLCALGGALLAIASVAEKLMIGGAAVTTAVVAVKGLDAWKRQLVGKAAYRVAQRVLMTAYEAMDAIRIVRAPSLSFEAKRDIWVDGQGLPVDVANQRLLDWEFSAALGAIRACHRFSEALVRHRVMTGSEETRKLAMPLLEEAASLMADRQQLARAENSKAKVGYAGAEPWQFAYPPDRREALVQGLQRTVADLRQALRREIE